MKLVNHTFEEINVGDSTSHTKTLSSQYVTLFALASGDVNPIHLDEVYAKETKFKQRIGHGMWLGALISSVLGNKFPGPGTVYLSQNIAFKRPVHIDDTITVILEVKSKHPKRPILEIDCCVKNQNNKVVALGLATVMAPTDKLSIDAYQLSEIQLL